MDIIYSLPHRFDKSRASVDVCLCLLERLLNRSRPVSCSFEEEELNGGELSSANDGGCGSYIPHNILVCYLLCR